MTKTPASESKDPKAIRLFIVPRPASFQKFHENSSETFQAILPTDRQTSGKHNVPGNSSNTRQSKKSQINGRNVVPDCKSFHHWCQFWVVDSSAVSQVECHAAQTLRVEHQRPVMTDTDQLLAHRLRNLLTIFSSTHYQISPKSAKPFPS